MKNKLIEHIKTLIKEHEENYFTNFDDIPDDLDWESYSMASYDCGRYETLCNLLHNIENMEG